MAYLLKAFLVLYFKYNDHIEAKPGIQMGHVKLSLTRARAHVNHKSDKTNIMSDLSWPSSDAHIRLSHPVTPGQHTKRRDLYICQSAHSSAKTFRSHLFVHFHFPSSPNELVLLPLRVFMCACERALYYIRMAVTHRVTHD